MIPRFLRPRAPWRHDDDGSALLITVMVMAVITSLTTVVLAVSVNNLGAATRSQQSAGALDAADAGVTQAIVYLQQSAGRALTCAPTCASNPWGNQNAPQSVDLPGSTDQSFRVWIEPVPTTAPVFYRVHSRGRDIDGIRLLEVDVTLVGTHLPLGVFARAVNGGGSASVTRESIYTTGCVWRRNQIASSGIDAWTGIPASVHSSKTITEGNGSGNNCASDNKAIHKNGLCSSSYKYDHDSQYVYNSSDACTVAQQALGTSKWNKYYRPRDLDGVAGNDVAGSYLRDDAALRELFNVDDRDPFTPSQLDELRTIAQMQGTYFTSTTYTSPNPVTNPDAVLFFDLANATGNREVDLNNITGWGRARGLAANHADCKSRSLIIVIDGGDAKLNSNQSLAATLVMTSRAPYGNVNKANGTADFIGTIFADSVNLVGNVDFSLDECFMNNLSPHLNTVSVSNYIEIDR